MIENIKFGHKNYMAEQEKLRKELAKYTIRLDYKDMYGKEYFKEKDLSKIYGRSARTV